MPLTVQKINDDTSFLLTLTTPIPSATDSDEHLFTILIDPWLTGPSPILHASFAVSSHKTPCAIQSLTELSHPPYRQPDLVIISQAKNDHCNKETLCTLPKSWKGTILAVPAAAKKLRSWRYFDENQIQAIPLYNEKRVKSRLKLPLTKLSPNPHLAGELTTTNIATPLDLAGVHNAIALIYHPPSTKPLIILYTPHGLSSSLVPSHLIMNSEPLDLLLHSLNTEANPALLGGVISNGAPGGVPIAKMLRARYWISAHDEEKENAGVATKLMRCRRYGVEEVEAMLKREGAEGTRVVRMEVGNEFVLPDEGC